MTLTALILGGGPATGASINPARSLGPALMAQDTGYLFPYFVGLFGGGIIAGLFNTYLLSDSTGR
jgi:glycerol uptake facilitator-like aquaporin